MFESPHVKNFHHSHDGSGWCWYMNANMTVVFLDGINGTPYMAAWVRHGIDHGNSNVHEADTT